jgi:hypothetical protein
MSVALQSAETALDPLLAYARGTADWTTTCAATTRALHRRFRVRLFAAASFKPLAAFGATDQAGSGANQFDHPGSVALSGERAIVADVNNQRIVKLRVK